MEPTFDIASFLREPRRPASVSAVTASGRPALATMWFGFFEGRLWFHTPSVERRPSPFLLAAGEGREVAAMVATFDPPNDVRQVRVTGPATQHPHDPDRARSIYDRYVPDWTDAWSAQAHSQALQLWSLLPQRGMAVHYPNLENTTPVRWTAPPDWLS